MNHDYLHSWHDKAMTTLIEMCIEHFENLEMEGKWICPDLTDCLDFMACEVSEAMDLRLRRKNYCRNNPRTTVVTDEEIATEIFDAILMGIIAVEEILGQDLLEIAKAKLEEMNRRMK